MALLAGGIAEPASRRERDEETVITVSKKCARSKPWEFAPALSGLASGCGFGTPDGAAPVAPQHHRISGSIWR